MIYYQSIPLRRCKVIGLSIFLHSFLDLLVIRFVQEFGLLHVAWNIWEFGNVEGRTFMDRRRSILNLRNILSYWCVWFLRCCLNFYVNWISYFGHLCSSPRGHRAHHKEWRIHVLLLSLINRGLRARNIFSIFNEPIQAHVIHLLIILWWLNICSETPSLSCDVWVKLQLITYT